MPSTRPQRLGNIVAGVLKHVGEQHGALFTIQREWSQLVGRRLATHTKPVSLRRGHLVVVAERPGDSFSLSYQRAQLLERIQASTKDRVEEIIIRPGDPSTRATAFPRLRSGQAGRGAPRAGKEAADVTRAVRKSDALPN